MGADEVLFCSGTNLFETFVEILVGSKVASHADVLRGSSRVPAPRTGRNA